MRRFASAYDLVLIGVVLWLMFNAEWFAGGFGWCLLLGLSPSAWGIDR